MCILLSCFEIKKWIRNFGIHLFAQERCWRNSITGLEIIYKRTPDKLFGQDSIYSHHTSDNVDSRLPDVSLKTSGLCFFTRNETKPNTMLLKGMVLWTAKWYNVKKSRCNENNERLFTFALEFLAYNFTLKYEFESRRYRNDYINISLSFGFRFS